MAPRKRVVVAGLGDMGLLTAIRLSRHADVVGISVKPALVSGQELGVRLSRPMIGHATTGFRSTGSAVWIECAQFRPR